MKIDVYFLLRNREAQKKKIKEKKPDMEFRHGIYLLSPQAINFYRKKGKPKGSEVFFFESNSAPINIDKKDKDLSAKFLDNYIYENVIEQTGEMPKDRLKNQVSWIKDNVTVGNLIKWGLLVLIGGSAIGGWLGII